MDNTNRSSRGRNVPDTTDAPRRGGAGAPARTSSDVRLIGATLTTETLTIDGLERWLLFGAHWRVVDISNQHAVVDLCTCTGEPLDRLQTEDPAVIGYLRTAHCDLDFS